MSEGVPFTNDYQDLSNDQGFQFRFSCERCGNSYLSTPQKSLSGMAGDALRSTGSFLGGALSRAAGVTTNINRVTGSHEHGSAFRRATNEMLTRFARCPRCKQWVCRDVCWNPDANQCLLCAPSLSEEAAANLHGTSFHPDAAYPTTPIPPQTQPSQSPPQNVATPPGSPPYAPIPPQQPPTNMPATSSVPSTRVPDSPSAPNTPPAAQADCAACGASLTPGAKFCGACGTKVEQPRVCPQCGTQALPGANFCVECGTKMP